MSSGKNRPDESKYGNPKIMDKLKIMSHNKCFYSEELLVASPKNIDHLMEVALDKKKAFDWDNLYLSAPECNQGRPNNNEIPIADVLDPCKDSDEEIQQHLTFENELIQANNCSKKGMNTIKKFKLDNEALTYKRSKLLQRLCNFIISEERTREADGRVHLNEQEKNNICSWASPDREFSLMVEVYLRKNKLM